MSKHRQVHRVTGAKLVVPSRLAAVVRLDGLEEREQALGIEPGSMFFTDPDYRVDARLTCSTPKSVRKAKSLTGSAGSEKNSTRLNADWPKQPSASKLWRATTACLPAS
ncbi:hypothetical protein [Micromonospora sp. NBC_01412]|uniref:hypothetical protein n=1 Tax=Micromonospora sp. NBC_01412 TaxID=2903590 RepID=UPI00324CF599